MHAIEQGYNKVVDILLLHKANTDIQNNQHKTARQIAYQCKNKTALNLFAIHKPNLKDVFKVLFFGYQRQRD